MEKEELEKRRVRLFRSNIYVFDCFVVEIFAELYKKFPVKMQVDGNEVVRNCKYEDNQEINYFERILILKGTFEFLKENGFIDYIGNIDEFDCTAYDCILTLKGLNALENIPKSINKKTTIGQKLLTELKSGTREIAIDLIKQVIRL